MIMCKRSESMSEMCCKLLHPCTSDSQVTKTLRKMKQEKPTSACIHEHVRACTHTRAHAHTHTHTKSLMKKQFIITHQHTILQEGKKLDISLTDQYMNMLCFYKTIQGKQFFCGHNILTSLPATHLSRKVGILVCGIAWVTTSCCFMSDVHVWSFLKIIIYN
jgi:hypothetical protein